MGSARWMHVRYICSVAYFHLTCLLWTYQRSVYISEYRFSMIATSSMPTHVFTDAPVQTSRQRPAGLQDVKYTPLHPTFGAEVSGLDFSTITQEKVDEIKRALAVVRDLCVGQNLVNSSMVWLSSEEQASMMRDTSP